MAKANSTLTSTEEYRAQQNQHLEIITANGHTDSATSLLSNCYLADKLTCGRGQVPTKHGKSQGLVETCKDIRHATIMETHRGGFMHVVYQDIQVYPDFLVVYQALKQKIKKPCLLDVKARVAAVHLITLSLHGEHTPI